MKIKYIQKRFTNDSLTIIDAANTIINEYQQQGYTLTLRQLYYQFVARGWLENTVKSYNRLGGIINNARLAGAIDWESIEDRTRNLQSINYWDNPRQILRAAAYGYRKDRWKNQETRIEVWIEKEALAGVFDQVCTDLDIPFLSCRGYLSQSEMWRASRRLLEYKEQGYRIIILHFGDHDPSGIDMTRDIVDRLRVFWLYADIHRIALNMDQIEEHNPPPNPAKETDSRFQFYVTQYGDESWELDALDPTILSELVRKHVISYRDEHIWSQTIELEEQERKRIETLAEEFEED